jgi:transcriptional regulator NrdR family protein
MGANRMGPPCPNCGSEITDVKSTYRSAEGDFVRRRVCPACNYRFYTAQPTEALLHRRSVEWRGRVPTIFWEDVLTAFKHILVKDPI